MRFHVEIKNNGFKVESEKLKSLNGQTVEVIVIPYETPEYWQHKYYRGYLLPAIAEALGERETSCVHLFLKAKYLLEKINNLDEIPKAQLRRGIYIAKLDEILNMSMKLTQYITGAVIVSDREEQLCGYIPSLALITAEKMNKFLYDCENCLTTVGGNLNVEAVKARDEWRKRI